MPTYSRDTPHFFLEGTGKAGPYSAKGGGQSKKLASRDQAAHSAAIRAAIQLALAEAVERRTARNPEAVVGQDGFYLEIEVARERQAALDSLSNRKKGIELVSVRERSDGDMLVAGVFVPDVAKDYFSKKLDAYDAPPNGNKPPKNQKLIEAIEDVRIAQVATVFTDAEDDFPAEDVAVWWEVWLRKNTASHLFEAAKVLEVRVLETSVVRFRERDVVLVHATPSQLGMVLDHTDAIAEVRLAAETPASFLQMDGAEQHLWADDLKDRITYAEDNAPAVCLLDTGVNRGHPLISDALAEGDLHTYEPAWGTSDGRRHGTQMAGIALLGDLTPILQSTEPLVVRHRLESVKIFPPEAAAPHEPDLYGWVTQEGIARAEVSAPQRKRVISLSITSDDIEPLGRPSQWSAKIDELSFGPEPARLFVVAAGNIRTDVFHFSYPAENDISAIEDPAQAWNALTVGAYTDRVLITDDEFAASYVPIAETGDLSPSSRTSMSWSQSWPIKPDIVGEGGNFASEIGNPGEAIDDLQILTTNSSHLVKPFSTFGETCAAVADVSRMSATIMAHRAEFWPETVRALMVHSAEWTPRMMACVLDKAKKSHWRVALRRYGYGVPNIQRALWSAQNDLTLVVQDELQPFHKPKKSKADPSKPNSSVLMNQMKLHTLPWPLEELQDLQEAEATCRITLSYFVEPNPGERGWTRKHRYASHGLRFALKWADETHEEFVARVSAALQKDDEDELDDVNVQGSDNWRLGPRQRNVGSLHSDFWIGTAAALASRDAIAVFPVGGWWKEKSYLDRFNQRARYSLIVSLAVPSATIDIRALVAAKIEPLIEIAVPASSDEQ